MSESNRPCGFPPRLCRPLPRLAGYPSSKWKTLRFALRARIALVARAAWRVPLLALSLWSRYVTSSPLPAVIIDAFCCLSYPFILPVICLSNEKALVPLFSLFEDPGALFFENKNGILFENPANRFSLCMVLDFYDCGTSLAGTTKPSAGIKAHQAPHRSR